MLHNTPTAHLLLNRDIMMLKIESLGLLIVFASAGSCCFAGPPEDNTPKRHNLVMDRQMLEFLAEFEEMDDEEFELLVSYAKKDSSKEAPESEVQQND